MQTAVASPAAAHEQIRESWVPMVAIALGRGAHDGVAQRSRLDRAGDDGAPGGIGGELVEEFILRAAADDVQAIHLAVCQRR